ncbi:MAG: tRNA (adenosine(37)-N6)-dimethylallyltransferase MiaA [Pseudomonadota bacterium]
MAEGVRDTVLCLMGPTAMGKTEVAMRIADRLPVDLISVDSALVYRGLNIGTAKPSPEMLARYPHALIDIVDPEQPYSVAQFVQDCTVAIEASHARGRTPLLVGGTMLYFKRLLDGLADLPEADPDCRREIDAQAQRVGWPGMHLELIRVDPDAAARIAPNDAQRIQRALEVYRLTGHPISALQSNPKKIDNDWTVARMALLTSDRTVLHERIQQRFEQMVEAGFVDEVKGLLKRPGVHTDLPSLRAVGYRQIAAWLAGDCEYEQAIQDAMTATRRLAKRQHTWLRGMPDIHVFDPLESDPIGPITTLCEQVLAAETAQI